MPLLGIVKGRYTYKAASGVEFKGKPVYFLFVNIILKKEYVAFACIEEVKEEWWLVTYG